MSGVACFYSERTQTVFRWFLCCVFICFSFLSHCQDAASYFFLLLLINLSSYPNKFVLLICRGWETTTLAKTESQGRQVWS